LISHSTIDKRTQLTHRLCQIACLPSPHREPPLPDPRAPACPIEVAVFDGGEISRMGARLALESRGIVVTGEAQDEASALAALAARGETSVPRSITALLVDYVRVHSAAAPLAALMPSEQRLTRRELAVLESVARGNTNRAVAAELSISVETVRSHVSHILAKL